MRKSIVVIVAVLLTVVSLGAAVAEISVDNMSQSERNALLVEILKRNAEDMRGRGGGIRQFSTISRSAPVLCGETARFGLTKSGFDMNVTLKSIAYGDEAFAIVKDANAFNSDPKDGEEYIVVTFVVEAYKDGHDTISITKDDFEFVSRSGAVYKNKPYIVGINDEVELYDGGIDELQIAHVIDEGDVPFALLVGSIWFDLAPSAKK